MSAPDPVKQYSMTNDRFEPNSGLLITFTQLLFTTVVTLPTQIRHNGRSWGFRPTVIPLERLGLMAIMFFGVNMLNNWAFAFNISVPMHIILRSFGSVTTMLVGWAWGNRYSRLQVSSVAVLTVGVVLSAWSDAKAKGAKLDLNPVTSSADAKSSTYSYGLLILLAAQVLGAVQGIYTEITYRKHGRHWQETIFFSHFFGMFFSLAFAPALFSQLQHLLAGPRAILPVHYLTSILPTGVSPSSTLLNKWHLLSDTGPFASWHPPTALLLLALNASTQILCISGVNQLAARTSAVTVTVVLNIRKLVSFLLSCVIFGNTMDGLMALGAATVFASGAVYGWDSSRSKAKPLPENKVSEEQSKSKAR